MALALTNEPGAIQVNAQCTPHNRRHCVFSERTHQPSDSTHAGHRHGTGRDDQTRSAGEGEDRRSTSTELSDTSTADEFQALQEDVEFRGPDGAFIPYTHTARFGEIEQRGAALTRKGRRLYDDLLALARQRIGDAPEGSPESETAFAEAFAGFPDTWSALRAQDLVYFKYTLVPGSEAVMAGRKAMSMADLVSQGVLSYEPITYEDFLPFSAVGIFMSNVKTESNGSSTRTHETGPGAKSSLEEVLGCRILDEFDLYRSMQRRSIDDCRRVLGLEQIVKS